MTGRVRIHNLEPIIRDITLTNGEEIRLAPFSFEGTAHISQPILKKFIPEALKKLHNRRWIKLEEV